MSSRPAPNADGTTCCASCRSAVAVPRRDRSRQVSTVKVDVRSGRLTAAAAVLVLAGATLLAAGCGSDDASSTASVAATIDAGSGETTGESSTGASSPGDTSAPAVPDSAAPGSAVPGALPQGFTTVEARITASDGEVCEVCLWLADTDEERGTGLMG